MGLQKHDVMVDCDHCEFASSNVSGSFEITVPLEDLTTGTRSTAVLSCEVSANAHEIRFQGWKDKPDSSRMASDDLADRISSALDFVAQRRICGNAKICPSEVVAAVQRRTSGQKT